MSNDFAARLAAALEDAITRNPLLSKETWGRYNDLLAEYNATVTYSYEDGLIDGAAH